MNNPPTALVGFGAKLLHRLKSMLPLIADQFVSKVESRRFSAVHLRQNSKEKNPRMFKEFKEFAMRGNVLDLAIGIVIGAAFAKIITSFVSDILMPPRLIG